MRDLDMGAEARTAAACTCPDPYCQAHARCGACGGEVIVLEDDPAFCPSCGHDVMPARACRLAGDESS